jgi:acyl carrier protein
MEPPSEDQVLQEVQGMMKDLFQLDPGRVHPGAKLVDDLELDSLDAIDLAVRVEEDTGLKFDETRIRQLKTVGDLVGAIHAHSPQRAARAAGAP